MGLDPCVPCRCWQDGLASELSFSRDLLEFENESLYVRDDASRSLDDTIRMDRLLDDWLENCCHRLG